MSDCPIHQSDEALTWCMSEGVTINTYFGKVLRVTHRPSRRSVVRCIGGNGFSLPGDFMMATRDLWAKVEAYRRVTA